MGNPMDHDPIDLGPDPGQSWGDFDPTQGHGQIRPQIVQNPMDDGTGPMLHPSPTQTHRKSLRKELLRALPVKIIALILTGAVLYILIPAVATWITDFFNSMGQWTLDSALNPMDRGSFKNFVKLVLTTGCVWVAYYILRR